ncbi:mitochondrial import receptor subunit TOM70 isoform X1 [Nematostella vectensis]|uniref:mitochondrial import receptor subunit TOM70 isoform X1 n=1 Tax=Nematostella vectensis TaxID=45351 RepID=UPI0020778EC7|nr:mitochondrial import receptor subunit TOM70 isoform X1 [Nematostella vectensis]
MSSQQSSSGFEKWQIALLIGAPVAVVCVAGAVWYWRNSQEGEEEGEREDEEKGNHEEKKAEDDGASEAKTTNMTPSEQAQVAKLKGNKYFKGCKYEQAIKCYTEAIELCPPENKQDLSTFYQNRAAAYEQMNQFENVVEEATKALELNSKYTKALMRRARALEKLERKQECLQDLTAVCILEGFSNPSWMMHADRVLKDIGRQKAKEHFKNRKPTIPSPTYIKAYLESFSQDEIFSDDLQGQDDVPNDSPFLAALEEIKEKRFDKVIDLCDDEINRGPSPCYARAMALRGTMHTLMSQVKEAIDDLTQVIDMDDDKASTKLKINCLIKRGSLHIQETREAEADQDFKKAILLDPNNSDIYHHRAQIHFLTEKIAEAKEDFEKCIKLNPDFIPARIQLAYCIYKTAVFQQNAVLARGALELFEEISTNNPDNPDALSLHAQVLQEQGQFEEACEKFDTAIKLQPENPVHKVYKGLLMVQWKQDFGKSVELVNEAISMDSKCDFAYETLATLEVQRGNLEKSVELFDKAIDLVRTEGEMAQTFSLREAAIAQHHVTKKMGIVPNFMG